MMFELDENYYPTDETLENIKNYKGCFVELMNEIQPLFVPYGNCYEIAKNLWKVSTGGWSGCEDIIDALGENKLFWSLCWESSRKGGHYEFEVKRFKSDEQ